MANYKLLNNVNFPADIKKLSTQELKTLSEELRQEMIEAVSQTGGHLGAGLGVVELTVALAYSLMNSSNIIDKCSYMVKSFHSIFPLTKIEIELLSTFIASRLLITVTMANIQKKKYPNNEYLTISENDAWNLLFKLKDINLDNLTLDLLKICNYEK